MDMPMMNVREVRMLVRHRRVLVFMRMRFLHVPHEVVRMLVMLVVYMGMGVFHWLVRVFMLVPLGQMQPHPQRHKGASSPETWTHRIAQPKQ